MMLMAENNTITRKVLAFWDSRVNLVLEDSLVHKTLEMPLNHLGLDVIYFDVQESLPDIAKIENIRGIILCFPEQTALKNPQDFIEWLISAIDRGKKIFILGNPGIGVDSQGAITPGDLQNRLFEKMGVTNTQEWVDYPFHYQIASKEEGLFSFERDYPQTLPSFYITRILQKTARSLLSVAIPGKTESLSDLIILSPSGVYASQYYLNNYSTNVDMIRSVGWYVNPFRFFSLIFDLELFPIPDTTTLAGRRIFFGTCHGDNWNTLTSIEEYENKEVSCSEILLEKVFKPNPDLPMSVGVVAADVDLKWVGTKKSQEVARKYFELPHIEAASHTYSHPFFWDFFKTGDPDKEIPFLYLYPHGAWKNSFLSWMHSKLYQSVLPKNVSKSDLPQGYVTPRAYANKPFKLDLEIEGSVSFLNQFSPPSNPVKFLIWSGDSLPWSKPVELCKKAGIKQFGGGDVRFDPDYPSMLFVSPIGRKPGGIIQLYETADAENSYTGNWTGPFYGYKYLPATLKNTESPRRLKPMQLYFHSYSGQFQPSVDALLSNIDYIRSQSPISIFTSRYVDIGEGFYAAQIEPLGPNIWKIRDRKGLQTVRFDNNPNLQADLSKSQGVIGYINYQDSLYIYLDSSEQEPIVATGEKVINQTPYLVDSSWEIWNLKREMDAVTFKAKGWGKLSMRWYMPNAGKYAAVASTQNVSLQIQDGILFVELDLPFNKETEIKIYRES